MNPATLLDRTEEARSFARGSRRIRECVALGILLGALFLWTRYEYDYQNAVTELGEAGIRFELVGPTSSKFALPTWKPPTRRLHLNGIDELRSNIAAIRRFKPTELLFPKGYDAPNLELGGACKELKILRIFGSPVLEDIMEIRFIRDVEWLQLYGCTALKSIDSLRDMSIEHLSLTELPQLESVAAIGTVHRLRFLDLWGLPNVSSIKPLASLKSIKRLSIRDCPRISEAAVNELRAALPNAQIYFTPSK
jgi:hypothetical protein